MNSVNYCVTECQDAHVISQIQDGTDVSVWHAILKVSYFLIEY